MINFAGGSCTIPTSFSTMKYSSHIDFFRAVLIALVILVHVVHLGDLYPTFKSGVLAFIMPAFLVVTGYLVNINKGVKDFALYLFRILLPYCVMVSGFAFLSLYLPVRDGLEEPSISALTHVLLVKSIGPYWFLHTMTVCAILYYAAFRLPKRLNDTAKFSLFASLLILVALFTPLLKIESGAYYFIGVGIRLYLKDFSKAYTASLWPLLPFALLISQSTFYHWSLLWVLACVLCFFCFSARLCSFLSDRTLSMVSYVGKNTFPIYILHPIFTMLAKFYLPLFHFDPSGILHALFTLFLALVGSLSIAKAMDYTHLSYLLGRKRMLR